MVWRGCSGKGAIDECAISPTLAMSADDALTSPPQWAITRNFGAIANSSSPNRGLSHVVIIACASANPRLSARVNTDPEIFLHWKARARRR